MTKASKIISMHMLCHNLIDKLSFFRKSFSIFLTFLIFAGLAPSVISSESNDKLVLESQWRSNYQTGLDELADFELSDSEASMLKAVALAQSANLPEQIALSEKGLSLIACAQAVETERRREEELAFSKRNLLYGVVIIMLALVLLSFLIRYGPQRPDYVDKVDRWVQQRMAVSDSSATNQAVVSMFSILIFALSAFGLLLIVLGFLWLLSAVSVPSDGSYPEAQPYYQKGIQHLGKAQGLSDGNIDRVALLKNYRQFLLKRGRKKEALDLLTRLSKAEALLTRQPVEDYPK